MLFNFCYNPMSLEFFWGGGGSTSAEYGGSQAGGRIRAAAVSLNHSHNTTRCNLHHSSQQCWILNPLIRARDQTCILIDTSRVHYHWATMETLRFILLIYMWKCKIHRETMTCPRAHESTAESESRPSFLSLARGFLLLLFLTETCEHVMFNKGDFTGVIKIKNL